MGSCGSKVTKFQLDRIMFWVLYSKLTIVSNNVWVTENYWARGSGSCL
jgi:hypothetical protein